MNEVFILIYVIVLFTVLFIAFGLTIKNSQTRIDIEKGLKPIIEKSVGGQVGKFAMLNAPFGRFTVYGDFIVVRILRNAVIKKSEITSIEMVNNFWFRGIEIKYNSNGAHSRVRIKSFGIKELLNQLQEYIKS